MAQVFWHDKLACEKGKHVFAHNSLNLNLLLYDISSDFRLVGTEELYNVLNDIRARGAILEDIASDFRMKGNEVLSDIIDDFRMVQEELKDISNRFNSTIAPSLQDMNSDFRMINRVVSDITNYIIILDSIIDEFNNDFRSKKLEINDITNDFRLIADFQIPGDAGVESLGKEYIKVYISSEEQTDIDVDSISITKSLNASHTATFVLGRPYDDATKPSIESVVEIKYHIWTLYKGYITNIVPGNSPDTIKINCQNEYWKQNRTKEYFFVGHEPFEETKDTYRSTVSLALSYELGVSFGIGNFVPQTMSCFGVGKSDCITNLVTNSGNYGWFYDETGTERLWTAGLGSIVTLERQEIGKNLGLYQVLTHNFNEDVSGIVNKMKVQMGDKSIKRIPGSESYSHYEFGGGIAQPDWELEYEVLAKDSETKYGFDWHNIADESKYQKVYRRYILPDAWGFSPSLKKISSWTDRYPPVVVANVPLGGIGETWHCSMPLVDEVEGLLSWEQAITEGFTIDYENNLLIFDKPLYFYRVNEYGDCIATRRADIELHLWKINSYEKGDASSPLSFITSKMGEYSTTVTGFLELSQLSIQKGGTWIEHYDLEGGGYGWRYHRIPSWNDTNFAKDYANWQLSKTCDKKSRGSIELTLDAVCQYGIDLAKRINIPNVTELPLNIKSIRYDISNFTVTVELAKERYYKRYVSLPYRGEET